jgi:hypothetical protein
MKDTFCFIDYKSIYKGIAYAFLAFAVSAIATE